MSEAKLTLAEPGWSLMSDRRKQRFIGDPWQLFEGEKTPYSEAAKTIEPQSWLSC